MNTEAKEAEPKPQGKTYAETRLGIVLKDAEFIRAEVLFCIGRVRYLAIFAIGIAGAALPAIATILSSKSGDGPDLIRTLVVERALLLQLIMLGVSLCAMALLQIYMGVFKQIFTFAKYFREVLIPDINKTLGLLTDPTDENHPAKQPVMRWEMWLQGQRAPNKISYTADSDLAAEPVLISAVCVIYMASCVAVSWVAQSFFAASVVVAVAAGCFVLEKFFGFRRVLAESTEA